MPRRRQLPKVAYTLLVPAAHKPLYARVRQLIDDHHPELTHARIVLAWCTTWRLDADGHLTLGRCKRASDLDRELAPFDFVILLNREWWEHDQVTPIQRDALLDHELCHATIRGINPRTGEPIRDARDRIVYRLRKHDVEEFIEIPQRYGLWKRELEAFAQGLKPQARLPIDEDPARPGVTTTVN